MRSDTFKSILSFYDDLLRSKEAEEAIEEQASEARIAKGPPDPRISVEQWHKWCRYDYIVCPASKLRHICEAKRCSIGLKCRRMAEIGFDGTGEPIRKADRVRCEAVTRSGSPCKMAVVPGRRRCRLHGGLSTGPKTVEGKARIAEAQRKRWEAFREKGAE